MSSNSTRVSDNGAPFTRTNIPTADRTLLSHVTVQYFRSVHT